MKTALCTPFLFPGQNPAVATLSVTFVAIVLEAMPFLLIGALVGGFLEEFVAPQRLAAVLGLKRVGDFPFPLIRAENIRKTDPPRNPYLFPRLF